MFRFVWEMSGKETLDQGEGKFRWLCWMLSDNSGEEDSLAGKTASARYLI